MPFSMLGVELGLRSTVVRLRQGGLAIISPGPFEERDVAEIRALGDVTDLVAPNTMHHLYLSRAKSLFPEARVHVAPGLREKVKDLPQGDTLGDGAAEPFVGTLEQRVIRGTTLNEVVFLHPASKTLILTDLAFNVQKGGTWTRLFMKLNGCFGRIGTTRVLRKTFHDEGAVASSMNEVLSWDFERIVVSHGEIVESGGKEELARVHGPR